MDKNCYLVVALILLAHAILVCGESVKNCDTKSNPELSPLLCNWDFDKSHLSYYVCPRFLGNSSSAQHGQTAKEQWKKKFSDFYEGIEGKNITINVVGDSLNGELFHQWRCLEDLVGIAKSESILQASFIDPFLAKLPHQYVLRQESISFNLNLTEHWYHSLKTSVREGEKQYIVLNTGPWWDRGRVRARHNPENMITNEEVMEAYAAHFGTKSRLMLLIRSLQHANKTIVWRETAPSGICVNDDPFKSHSFFSKYNNISRNALRKENVLMLNIWNETLKYHDQHISERDVLHYCLFQSQSVLNIWIEKLFDLILKNEQ